MSGWWFIRSHGSTSRPMNATASGKDPNRNHLKISPRSRRHPGSSASRRSTSSSGSGSGGGVTSTAELLLAQLRSLEFHHDLAPGGVRGDPEPLFELAGRVQGGALGCDLAQGRAV